MYGFDQAPGPFAEDAAPPASHFPPYPLSWYFFGLSRDVPHGRPVGRDLLGRRLVAYRKADGRLVILDGRCSHFGADLGLGTLHGDAVRCAFHHWEYGPDGRCRSIPAGCPVPAWARQTSYPVAERHGQVFFFNAAEPLFPLPFFPDCRPEDFVASRPFTIDLECPWYLIGANAFDLQHFRAAHDRRLVGEPEVECPHPFARRATGTFEVVSNSFQDRVTRFLAGPLVVLSLTDWCGNMLTTTARFRRTCSYGLIVTEPLDPGRVRVRISVFVPRSASLPGRVFDPLHAWVRRLFILRFLRADADRLKGARYNPRRLIAADQHLADYFRWLARAAHGLPADRRQEEATSCPPVTAR